MRVAVVGGGRHAAALAGHGAGLGSVVITEADAAEALLVFGGVADAEAGLRAGKTVLCGPGVVRSPADLARLAAAGGRLLPGGEIAYSEAGRRGLAAIAAAEFGAVKSVYVAIRQARDAAGDVFELVAEAVDFVLAVLPGGFPAVRVNAGALFGAAVDTVVVVLRSESEVVVTIEVSRCLPPGLVLPGLGEVEIEVMGAAQSVRITPGSDAVQVWGEAGRRLVPWLNAPVLEMLRVLQAGEGADGLARAARALAVMQAIRAAA